MRERIPFTTPHREGQQKQSRGVIKFLVHATKRTYFDFFLKYIVGVPVYILILLIKPLIFIRLGTLYAAKIGPLASRIELYLCEKDHGIQPKSKLDIFISDESSFICNHQLYTMWKRLLYVNDIFIPLYKLMKKMPFGNKHLIEPTMSSRDVHGLLEKTAIHLKFLTDETTQANCELSRMGIASDDEYVLALNRGQRYLKEIFPNRDFKYHEWRNISINDYKPAMEELVKRGHFVIRVGHLVSDLMNIDNPKIIEYDHNGFRTELLDIYLGANCRFLLTSDSGYQAVPGWLFRRPLLNISCVSLEYLIHSLPSWLSIFSKYWLRAEKRFMKISEIIESGAGKLHGGPDYEKWGIEVIKNTPEEILEVVIEMEGRIDGTWQTTDDDDELQTRFWSYFQSSDYHNPDGKIRGRIGTNFLRQNRVLLA